MEDVTEEQAAKQLKRLGQGEQFEQIEIQALWPLLTTEEQGFVLDPGSHPGLAGQRSYPLSSVELAALVGVDLPQIVRWTRRGLSGGLVDEPHYGADAAILACALSGGYEQARALLAPAKTLKDYSPEQILELPEEEFVLAAEASVDGLIAHAAQAGRQMSKVALASDPELEGRLEDWHKQEPDVYAAELASGPLIHERAFNSSFSHLYASWSAKRAAHQAALNASPPALSPETSSSPVPAAPDEQTLEL
jgi:hypothetical protein